MFRTKKNWNERIAQILELSVTELRPERSLSELVHDSFAYVELALTLQEESGVRLSQADLQGIRTVGDLVDRLERMN